MSENLGGMIRSWWKEYEQVAAGDGNEHLLTDAAARIFALKIRNAGGIERFLESERRAAQDQTVLRVRAILAREIKTLSDDCKPRTQAIVAPVIALLASILEAFKSP